MTSRPTDDRRLNSWHNTAPRYSRQAHGASGAVAPAASAPRPSEARFDPRSWREARAEAKEQIEHQASPVMQVRQEPPRAPARDVRSVAQPSSAAPLSAPKYLPDSSPVRSPISSSMASSMSVDISHDMPSAAVIGQIASNDAGAPHGRRTRYLAVWAVLGSISAAYLAGMAWQRTSNFNVAIAPVADAIARLAQDVEDLRQTTSAIDARERQTSARLANAEARSGRLTEVSGATPSQAQSAPAAPAALRPTNRTALLEDAQPAAEPARAQRNSMAGVVLAPSGPMPGVAIPPPPSVIPSDTRLAPAAHPARAPAVNSVKTGSLSDANNKKQAGLLIGSGATVDALRQSWASLAQNHGGAMGPVEPRINPSPDGSSYQLIAGPYMNDFDAAKACSNLRTRGVACRPVEFSGSPL